MISRRAFGKLGLASLAFPRLAAAAIDSRVGGVRVGVQTYSFRELPRPAGGDAVDTIIGAMTACGLGECEVWAPQIEPQQPNGRGRPSADVQTSRDELRRWRLSTPLDHFIAIKKKFDAAGISIYASLQRNAGFTDEEMSAASR